MAKSPSHDVVASIPRFMDSTVNGGNPEGDLSGQELETMGKEAPDRGRDIQLLDLAANNGNWQWCASTGTDAMQGYRIFNPKIQSQKFDGEGDYIRRYVSELSGVRGKWIHEPHLMPQDEQDRAGCRIGSEYPAPIVDHRQARQEYVDLEKQPVAP